MVIRTIKIPFNLNQRELSFLSLALIIKKFLLSELQKQKFSSFSEFYHLYYKKLRSMYQRINSAHIQTIISQTYSEFITSQKNNRKMDIKGISIPLHPSTFKIEIIMKKEDKKLKLQVKYSLFSGNRISHTFELSVSIFE